MTFDSRPLALVYAALTIFFLIALWRWNADPRYQKFQLIDLVSEDGKLSTRKFMEFGCFVATTIGFLWQVLEGKATADLFGIYAGVFVLGRVGGQAVHAYTNSRNPKAAAIPEDGADEPDPYRPIAKPKASLIR